MKSFLQRFTLITSFSFAIIFCHAQPGTLDSSFGVNGKTKSEFGVLYNSSDPITIQQDGKIVVAATFQESQNHSHFVVSRYKTNGTVDSSFGTNGKVDTYFDSSSDPNLYVGSAATCIIIQPDGKILAGGYVYHTGVGPDYFALARYLPNGKPDSSFGKYGKSQDYIGPFPKENELLSLALTKNGKIIAGGSSDGYCVVRYNSNGIVDSSFGIDGIIRNQAIQQFGVTALHVQKDEKIVSGGTMQSQFFSADFEIDRLLPNGAYDSSFGNNGNAFTDFYGKHDRLYSVAILRSGNIVAAGATYDDKLPIYSSIALAKYDTNGKLDSSFGANGKVTTRLGETDVFANKVLEQDDGKLIVIGQNSSGDILVARFDLNGNIDSSFGNNGKTVFSFGSYSYTYFGSGALQNDGKIIAINGPSVSMARIKNDEPISINLQRNISVTEGNSGTTPAAFKIALNRPSAYDVQVNYTTVNGNAVSGSDYIAASGKAVIKAGKTSKIIVVNIIGDNAKEKNEKFALVIGNPVNAQLGPNDTATCTIKNDDPGFTSSVSDAVSSDVKTTGIKLYPNPARDMLRIDGLDATIKTTISIIDLKGNTVLKKSLSGGNASLNVQQLAAGLYEARIESAGKTQTIKFMKE